VSRAHRPTQRGGAATKRTLCRRLGVRAYGGLGGALLATPRSRERLPSKDFDADDDQMKILAKNQDSELGLRP
jgi:hypothetical protein